MSTSSWLSLGGHSKQARDERNLPPDVPLRYALHLPFPNHVHDLVPLQHSPRRFKREKAQPWLDESFDEAVILLDQVVELLHLAEFTGREN